MATLHVTTPIPGTRCQESREHRHLLWIPAYIAGVDRNLQMNTQRLSAEAFGGGSLAGKWNKSWLLTEYRDESADQAN